MSSKAVAEEIFLAKIKKLKIKSWKEKNKLDKKSLAKTESRLWKKMKTKLCSKLKKILIKKLFEKTLPNSKRKLNKTKKKKMMILIKLKKLCEIFHALAQLYQFYGAVFGWSYDVDPSGYVSCKAGDRVQAGMMAIDEAMGDMPDSWGVYILVEDEELTASKAHELGGTVLVPPTPAGEIGKFAVVQDPQGAVFSIIKYDGPAVPPPGY